MPMRHTFLLSDEKLCYEEEPVLRHVEPPLSSLLELVCDYQNACMLFDTLHSPYALIILFAICIYLPCCGYRVS